MNAKHDRGLDELYVAQHGARVLASTRRDNFGESQVRLISDALIKALEKKETIESRLEREWSSRPKQT